MAALAVRWGTRLSHGPVFPSMRLGFSRCQSPLFSLLDSVAQQPFLFHLAHCGTRSTGASCHKHLRSSLSYSMNYSW